MNIPIWMLVLDGVLYCILIAWGILVNATNTPEYIKRLAERREEVMENG